jgi:hypothetical protein
LVKVVQPGEYRVDLPRCLPECWPLYIVNHNCHVTCRNASPIAAAVLGGRGAADPGRPPPSVDSRERAVAGRFHPLAVVRVDDPTRSVEALEDAPVRILCRYYKKELGRWVPLLRGRAESPSGANPEAFSSSAFFANERTTALQ